MRPKTINLTRPTPVLPPRDPCVTTTPAQSEKKFYDTIVVGAGPAGNTAAYFLATAGLDVLLLERGQAPGSKTVGGAAIYTVPTHELFPNFWEEAPVERMLVEQQYWLLTEDSAIMLGFKSKKFSRAPYNRFSVHRATFDRWLAGKAVTAGAMLLTRHKADSLILDNGRVVGVRVGPPQNKEFFADCIVLAEGVNAILAVKAGLAPKLSPQNVGLYVKETIALPAATIEERFNLKEGQGTVLGLVGHNTAGFIGTASIYTNKDTLGINVGTTLANLAKARFNPSDLLERIKLHPFIQPLLAGGKPVEFIAHMIPEGGYQAVPPLVHPGLLIVGDAAGLVNGSQGYNLAMLSGKMAAKTICAAKLRNDFSAKQLSLYKELLDDSYIMQDLRANQHVPRLHRSRPWLYEAYNTVAAEIAYELSMVYPMPKRAKRRLIWQKVTSIQPVWKMAADLLHVLRVIR